jgi:hypothetical protein
MAFNNPLASMALTGPDMSLSGGGIIFLSIPTISSLPVLEQTPFLQSLLHNTQDDKQHFVGRLPPPFALCLPFGYCLDYKFGRFWLLQRSELPEKAFKKRICHNCSDCLVKKRNKIKSPLCLHEALLHELLYFTFFCPAGTDSGVACKQAHLGHKKNLA